MNEKKCRAYVEKILTKTSARDAVSRALPMPRSPLHPTNHSIGLTQITGFSDLLAEIAFFRFSWKRSNPHYVMPRSGTRSDQTEFDPAKESIRLTVGRYHGAVGRRRTLLGV